MQSREGVGEEDSQQEEVGSMKEQDGITHC